MQNAELKVQEEFPPTEPPLPPAFATVHGEVVVDLPQDLYIPPEAMKVFLEAFEGPLDFLLYLIRKQNIDILDIPVAKVTQQYMEYIDVMQVLSLELAAEYLVMAAILAEIKSRMLLPKPPGVEDSEADPRAELVRRLQEYERYQRAAQDLDQLPRQERDIFIAHVADDNIPIVKSLPHVNLIDLAHAFADVIKRVDLHAHHQVRLEALSVREKMSHILTQLTSDQHVEFTTLFNLEEGKLGIVVTFLAMLELLRQHIIDYIQSAPFAPIYLKLNSTAGAHADFHLVSDYNGE